MKRIVYFLILLLLPSVFAVGITPGNQTVDVFPNHNHTVNFCAFNSDGLNLSLDFEAPGDFIEEFKFSKNNFIAEGRQDCLSLFFKTSEFKSINESEVTGLITITDHNNAPIYSAIQGKIFMDLSEMSYRRHATLNFGKFSLVAISIFLAGAAIIYLLSLREQHE